MLTHGLIFYGQTADLARRSGVHAVCGSGLGTQTATFIDGGTGMRPPKRRTHAAERTTSTRAGAGSRRNKRTGYAARGQQSRAFGQVIRRYTRDAFLIHVERAMIGSPVETARLRGLLDTLPNATLELRGTFDAP